MQRFSWVNVSSGKLRPAFDILRCVERARQDNLGAITVPLLTWGETSRGKRVSQLPLSFKSESVVVPTTV